MQSNVTSQIKALEAELGTQLFDRLAKRVLLTEAGHRFLPYAEKALAAMEQGCRRGEVWQRAPRVLCVLARLRAC